MSEQYSRSNYALATNVRVQCFSLQRNRAKGFLSLSVRNSRQWNRIFVALQYFKTSAHGNPTPCLAWGHVDKQPHLSRTYHSSTTYFQRETLTAMPETDSPRCFRQSRVEACRLVPLPFSPRSPKDHRFGHAVAVSRLEKTLLWSSSSSSPHFLGHILRSDQHQSLPYPPRCRPVQSL